MRVTSSTLLSLRSSQSAWTHMTVEWSPKVALVQSQLLPVATHFVLPDLPSVYSDQSRAQYFQETAPNQRIRTIACSHHTTDKCLLETIRQLPSCDKILLVGGNDKKSSSTLSTTEAAKIILSSSEKIVELWGVTNPNDPNSVDSVGEKIQAGITGFLTQPLLSSTALETIHEYNLNETVPLIAGLALPTSAKNLQFWCKLLEQPELAKDSLFQSHLAFFSQPYYTSMIWIGRELQSLQTLASNSVHGIHFMPLGNTQDLLTIFKSLGASSNTNSTKET